MKTACPWCQQHYEIESQYLGSAVECTSCGKAFKIAPPEEDETVPELVPVPEFAVEPVTTTFGANLTACPDCGNMVSKLAAACPRCGRPFQAPAVVDDGVRRPRESIGEMFAKADREQAKRSGGFSWFGFTLMAIISFVIIGSLAGSHASGEAKALVTIILLALTLFVGFWGNASLTGSQQHIICPNTRCCYTGPGKVSGGTSGCLLLILFCLGILPGILYLLFAGKPGVVCPRCGMQIR